MDVDEKLARVKKRSEKRQHKTGTRAMIVLPMPDALPAPLQDANAQIVFAAAGPVASDVNLPASQEMIVPPEHAGTPPQVAMHEVSQHERYMFMLYARVQREMYEFTQALKSAQDNAPTIASGSANKTTVNNYYSESNSLMFFVCICVCVMACAVTGMAANMFAGGESKVLFVKGFMYMTKSTWVFYIVAIHLLAYSETRYENGAAVTIYYTHLFFLGGPCALYNQCIETQFLQDLHQNSEMTWRKWVQSQFSYVDEHFDQIKNLATALYEALDEALIEVCKTLPEYEWHWSSEHLLAAFAMLLCFGFVAILVDYREKIDKSLPSYTIRIQLLRMIQQLVVVSTHAVVFIVVTQDGKEKLYELICQLVQSMHAIVLSVPQLEVLCLTACFVLVCCLVSLPHERRARVGRVDKLLLSVLLPGHFALGAANDFDYDALESLILDSMDTMKTTTEAIDTNRDSEAKKHFVCHFILMAVLYTALLTSTQADYGFKSDVKRLFCIQSAYTMLIVTAYYQFRETIEKVIGNQALQMGLIQFGLWEFFQEGWLSVAKFALLCGDAYVVMHLALSSIISLLCRFISSLCQFISSLRQLISSLRDASPIELLTPSHAAE